MQDPDFGYQDFARRDEDQTQVFRVQVRLLALPAGGSPCCRGAVVVGCPCGPERGCPSLAAPLGGSAPQGDPSDKGWGGGGHLLSSRTAAGPLWARCGSARRWGVKICSKIIPKLPDEARWDLRQSKPTESCCILRSSAAFLPGNVPQALSCSGESLLLCSTGLLLGRPRLFAGEPSLLRHRASPG